MLLTGPGAASGQPLGRREASAGHGPGDRIPLLSILFLDTVGQIPVALVTASLAPCGFGSLHCLVPAGRAGAAQAASEPTVQPAHCSCKATSSRKPSPMPTPAAPHPVLTTHMGASLAQSPSSPRCRVISLLLQSRRELSAASRSLLSPGAELLRTGAGSHGQLLSRGGLAGFAP